MLLKHIGAIFHTTHIYVEMPINILSMYLKFFFEISKRAATSDHNHARMTRYVYIV